MKVEIWSDIVCPFCYIGKRKFENALNVFDNKEQVEIVWHSYQLDPDMIPVKGQSVDQYLAIRKGVTLEKGKEMNNYMSGIAKDVGLVYNFDKAVVNNTMNAHRLLHLAKKEGIQNEVKEKLFAAYYTDGKDVGDTEILVQVGESGGLNGEAIRTMLDSNEYLKEVRIDQFRGEQLGVEGVPFFIFNNKYAVSGAQSAEIFSNVLEKVWQEENPLVEVTASAGFCTAEGVCN